MTICYSGGPLSAFSFRRKEVSREIGLQFLLEPEPKLFKKYLADK